MEFLITLLSDGFSFEVDCFGGVGNVYTLYEHGVSVLVCYDLETFIKHASLALCKMQKEKSLERSAD